MRRSGNIGIDLSYPVTTMVVTCGAPELSAQDAKTDPAPPRYMAMAGVEPEVGKFRDPHPVAGKSVMAAGLGPI